jgi:hypothetical protein
MRPSASITLEEFERIVGHRYDVASADDRAVCFSRGNLSRSAGS